MSDDACGYKQQPLIAATPLAAAIDALAERLRRECPLRETLAAIRETEKWRT